MVNKLAIDWDESELRMVAAQCSGGEVRVTDAAVIPVKNENIRETLREAIQQRGLEKAEALVAIGRGKAELRELQLPPVPDEELPDMVRFQAIRSFASAGDSATVDFLVTKRSSEGVEIIAAAVGPSGLAEIHETCAAAALEMKRIALRPLAAAALFLTRRREVGQGDIVLIDLLANDAEIVVTRNGGVIFVRTVRMPSDEKTRGKALAGELRRSLVACGSRGSLDRVVLWGRESVHAQDREMLATASDSKVEVLDPFDLVDDKAQTQMPDHVGRLAPLIGLLAADEGAPDRLVDFLNPRHRPEEAVHSYRKFAMIAIPIAAVALIAFMMYRQLSNLDSEIANLRAANAERQDQVDRAIQNVRRTQTIDTYLDGNVNWLEEIRRLAVSMPPAEEMIVRRIAGSVDERGGGTLNIVGGVTEPEVIDSFEQALRAPSHRVSGGGASEIKSDDAYGWRFTETVTIDGAAIRETRYAAFDALNEPAASTDPGSPTDPSSSTVPTESDPAESDPAATERSSDQPSGSTPQDPQVPALKPEGQA